MLRRRPRLTASTRVGHPAAGWLFLAALYLTATTANVLLAVAVNALWPALLATVLALVTVLCAAVAWRRR